MAGIGKHGRRDHAKGDDIGSKSVWAFDRFG